MGALSAALSARFGRGYSATNLRWFRQFYLAHPGLLPIHHSLRDESDTTARSAVANIHHALSDESAIGKIQKQTQRRDKTRLLKQGMMQELLSGRTRLV